MSTPVNLLTSIALGTSFNCPEKGYSTSQIVVGHANVHSVKDEYPQMVLIYDAFGCSQAPDVQYLAGLRAVSVTEWVKLFSYINENNPYGNSPTAGSISNIDTDTFKLPYTTYHKNVLDFIDKGYIPFPGGNVNPTVLLNMLGLKDTVSKFVSDYPNSTDTLKDYTDALHALLQSEWKLLMQRMSLVVTDGGIEDVSSSRHSIGYSYCKSLKPILDELGFVDADENDYSDTMQLADVELFDPLSLLWEHNTSGQKYRVLGIVDNEIDRDSPLLVYANATNNNVYIRKASDWLRSMSLSHPDDET